ncbi:MULTISPECIES: hypothetical protein [Streptomyces]|uniref:DUF3592 domain-containing protein n=2 Tax=Streptomyces TaxID=1883 RepID=A0A2U9P615_STRAS|nr:hypothetical protein [Streptomyces actuosus]AWT44977.1 hypothetical protein DMT42_23570 [Streptomyces actuosus]MBM4821536.1 hypothetical protein [Streptomyces actuosus]
MKPSRVALIGVTVILAGYALLAAWLGGHAYAYTTARDRATATASGTVVEDGVGDDEDIRVRWTDRSGHTHVERFGVYDTGRYAEGRRFPVAYDPDAADPSGFPADPEETAAEDDLLVPLALAGSVALAMTGVWAWRGVRFRLTGRRPGRPMTAVVRAGERPQGWRAPETTWLALTDGDGRTVWQRVMGHPALHGHDREPVEVTVHGRTDTRRPVVVELPDGTRLVPLGRLRRGAPLHELLDRPRSAAGGLRDAFVIPAGTVVRPARAWWRQVLLLTGGGAVVGLVMSLALAEGGLTGTVGFVLAMGALLPSVWILSAPQP